MIAAVEGWQETQRILRIADDGIEIDHGIISLAGANPVVDCLALRLPSPEVITRAFKRRQRGAEDFQAVFMRARRSTVYR